jgi:hypothetical protein
MPSPLHATYTPTFNLRFGDWMCIQVLAKEDEEHATFNFLIGIFVGLRQGKARQGYCV